MRSHDESTAGVQHSIASIADSPAQGPLALIPLFSSDPALTDRVVALGTRLRIGRIGGAELDLSISDTRLSRLHGILHPAADGHAAEVHDQASHNGSFIDGQRVTSQRMRPGSVLRMGDTLFELSFDRPVTLDYGTHGLVGRAPAFSAMLAQLERCATTALSLLVLGETGTGKEYVARAAHALSQRKGAFVAVNCAALPKDLVESALFGHARGAFSGALSDKPGYMEAARGGTLFLDEVTELPWDIQAKLLRALETYEYSPVGETALRPAEVRVIAASNADMSSEVASGAFRSDLYARLAGYVLHVPPLRQRRADAWRLACAFMRVETGREQPCSVNFVDRLMNDDWPMNVRELKSVVKRLLLDVPPGETLRSGHLERALQRTGNNALRLAASPDVSRPDRETLATLLREHAGNVAAVATHFGKDRKQVYRWLERHELDANDFKPR